MKRALLLSIVLTGKVFASTFTLPATMDAGSVQAKIKELLFNKLEASGPITSPYEASLTGSYREVKLEDKHSKIVCREFSQGMLAVQMFQCDITLNDGSNNNLASLVLPETMDAKSTQAVLREVLVAELEENGPITDPYTANLTGNWSHVVLEDRSSEVTCTEGSHSPLPVEMFSCSFAAKK